MSNKKETPVSWLMDKLKFIDKNSYNELYEHFDHALQMESQKQQKYDEMLAMLEGIIAAKDFGLLHQADFTLIEQLIKEAKEL
jgi:hypothetical protein